MKWVLNAGIGLLILAIAGLLFVMNYHPGGGGVSAPIIQITSLKTALSNYKSDTGRLPASLNELYQMPPNETNWKGPYLTHDVPPKDPWNRAYIYRVPGRNGREYDLLTTGRDGKEGTADDYTSWESE
jgi:general secretion pathway protein G